MPTEQRKIYFPLFLAKAQKRILLYTATYDIACQCVLVPGCKDYAFGLREAADYIEKAQTLDVAPVRHGRWVRCKGKSTLWHCSEFGERIVYNPTRKTYNICKKNVAEVNQFCRACGKKMDAGQEDENDG